SFCHYFAIMKPVTENESRHLGQNEMARLRGRSGPPGKMNAFKQGLAAIQKRREESIPTEHEESVWQQILDGLIADKRRGRADIDGHGCSRASGRFQTTRQRICNGPLSLAP